MIIGAIADEYEYRCSYCGCREWEDSGEYDGKDQIWDYIFNKQVQGDTHARGRMAKYQCGRAIRLPRLDRL
jgi:hypothetical protein